MEEKMAGVNNVKTIVRGKTTDKVSYSNHSNINLYSDPNNYINCPICIKPDATNTDNGPGTNSQ